MTLTLPNVLFWLLAAVTGVSAIGVVVTQNVVRAATWLLFALAGTAGIFFVLGADFVGATQLLIYVGGTLVLVVFGVMLTAQGPFINMKVSAAEWAIGMAVGLLLYGVLAFVMVGVTPEKTLARPEMTFATLKADLDRGVSERELIQQVEETPGIIKLTKEEAEELRERNPRLLKAIEGMGSRALLPSKHLGVALLGGHQVTRPDPMTGSKEARNVERTRLGYLLPFEIVSVHLLVVLIGAAYLARAKLRRAAAVPPDVVVQAPQRREAVTTPVSAVERH